MYSKSIFFSKFDEVTHHTLNLHPNLLKKIKSFSPDLNSIPNIIFYGAEGIGKYTLALKLIQRYSPQKLKYEKKLSLWSPTLKTQYYLKMSDTHFEIDMATLGCNAKSLWHDIFIQLVDSIYLKKDRSAIILCKTFHEINPELLEVFYSYVQPMNNKILYGINIKVIMLTTNLSFIPDSLLCCCRVISVPKPTKAALLRCFSSGLIEQPNLICYKCNSSNMVSISYMCDGIIQLLKTTPKSSFKLSKFRDSIYDLLSYNMNINDVMWYIFYNLYKDIPAAKLSQILIMFFRFFFYYNNNYRPIFHLELILLSLHLSLN